jgi:hypothetical protein
MGMGLIVSCFMVAISTAIADVADPAAEFSLEFTDAQGKKVTLNVAALASRTAAELATAIEAVLPAEYDATVVGESVEFFTIGLKDPVPTGTNAAAMTSVARSQTFSNSTGYLISAVGGAFLGKSMA